MKHRVIDVREPAEFSSNHVAGAINIPLTKLMGRSAKLDGLHEDDKLVIYCNSGNRSAFAKQIFEQMGFKNVTDGINQENVEQSYTE